MNLHQFHSTQEAVQHVVSTLLTDINQSLLKKNQYHIAVAGGTSVIPFFDLIIRKQEEVKQWNQVHFFWVDERWVPHHHAESNYGAALTAGLGKLQAHLHPFDTTVQDPQTSCSQYADMMERTMGASKHLDHVILGVGDDGHIASIFSGDITAAQQGITITTQHPQSGQPRVGLTLHTLSQAKRVTVLVFGDRKRKILEAIKKADSTDLPIVALLKLNPEMDIVTDIHA